MTYSIKFEKAKDYKRFNLHSAIVDANKFGEFSIEFFEDIDQPVDEVHYDEDGESQVVHSDFHVHRTLHAGATLHVHRIPDLINTLQEKLNAYNNYIKSQNSGENDGEA